MTTEATIIADSISPTGVRITTFQLRYQRFIHAELMTHRVFSRNASSSRAIPVEKMIEDLIRDPAMPVYWGSNQPGMQAGDELTGERLEGVKNGWMMGLRYAIDLARTMVNMGLHKQVANRILEPWAHINVVVTATDWENFFTLRCHEDAQPEIKVLADLMREARNNSTPELLQPGEWHLPFITKADAFRVGASIKIPDLTRDALLEMASDTLKKVSVARCARVSYLTHDGRQTSIEEDFALFERLVGSQPLHASPAEHQATPDVFVPGHEGPYGEWRTDKWRMPHQHGNLQGWIQYRKTLPNENIPG